MASNTLQAAAFIVVGGLAGAGGFAALGSAPPPAPTPIPVTVAAANVEVRSAPTPEAIPDGVTIAYVTTGSVESDAPRSAFAVFTVGASVDVADVKLTVSGDGARPEEAVGHEYSKTTGSVTVDVGDLGASQERTVVVGFTLPDESGRFTTHTAFRDLHTGEAKTVVGEVRGHSITRRMQVRDAYETVRIAYTEQAIEAAQNLMEESDWSQARAWLEDAYARNVEVGMALRLTGSLAGAQADLNALKDELTERSKPRAKRPVAKKPGIVWTFGDRPSPPPT